MSALYSISPLFLPFSHLTVLSLNSSLSRIISPLSLTTISLLIDNFLFPFFLPFLTFPRKNGPIFYRAVGADKRGRNEYLGFVWRLSVKIFRGSQAVQFPIPTGLLISNSRGEDASLCLFRLSSSALLAALLAVLWLKLTTPSLTCKRPN